MVGMGLGLCGRDHGVVGGLISALCHPGGSAAMAIAGVLPGTTQALVGWLCLGLAAVAGMLLATSPPAARPETQATQGEI
jgi:DHA1 family bicyclomycin/chloramphenicol resistance-like MFS transporter